MNQGSRLGHYELTARLGAGGMGEVFRATDTKLGREVALKMLPAEMASDPERLERFRREAKALAALDHPSIVTVFSVEEAEGAHFLTMQLVEGQTRGPGTSAAGLREPTEQRDQVHAGGGTITVRADLSGDAVEFSVADTGHGIPHQHLPHLFDRFWQAKRKAPGGTGLGLFIIKGIVDAHGGRIWADSEIGAGSTFRFTLPVAVESERPDE